MKINGYDINPEADLRGADLRGADLFCGADLRGADLCGVKYDKDTLFSLGKKIINGKELQAKGEE